MTSLPRLLACMPAAVMAMRDLFHGHLAGMAGEHEEAHLNTRHALRNGRRRRKTRGGDDPGACVPSRTTSGIFVTSLLLSFTKPLPLLASRHTTPA